MKADLVFKARKLRKRIETLMGELDVEIRLGTHRRHLDVRIELIDVKFHQLMAIHRNAHTEETKALEAQIEETARRVEARPNLRAV